MPFVPFVTCDVCQIFESEHHHKREPELTVSDRHHGKNVPVPWLFGCARVALKWHPQSERTAFRFLSVVRLTTGAATRKLGMGSVDSKKDRHHGRYTRGARLWLNL